MYLKKIIKDNFKKKYIYILPNYYYLKKIQYLYIKILNPKDKIYKIPNIFITYKNFLEKIIKVKIKKINFFFIFTFFKFIKIKKEKKKINIIYKILKYFNKREEQGKKNKNKIKIKNININYKDFIFYLKRKKKIFKGLAYKLILSKKKKINKKQFIFLGIKKNKIIKKILKYKKSKYYLFNNYKVIKKKKIIKTYNDIEMFFFIEKKIINYIKKEKKITFIFTNTIQNIFFLNFLNNKRNKINYNLNYKLDNLNIHFFFINLFKFLINIKIKKNIYYCKRSILFNLLNNYFVIFFIKKKNKIINKLNENINYVKLKKKYINKTLLYNFLINKNYIYNFKQLIYKIKKTNYYENIYLYKFKKFLIYIKKIKKIKKIYKLFKFYIKKEKKINLINIKFNNKIEIINYKKFIKINKKTTYILILNAIKKSNPKKIKNLINISKIIIYNKYIKKEIISLLIKYKNKIIKTVPSYNLNILRNKLVKINQNKQSIKILEDFIKHKGISFTFLNIYNYNKIKFYYNYILKIKKKKKDKIIWVFIA
ncbi:MAG: hypothetical protein NHG13_00455 [Candidatus Shikimatogenerans bostrichidophilus]|nr:MAG: hypothetical protein NHG13_00455 [Candidatus Shikimatogenerans bostrichidophilus]